MTMIAALLFAATVPSAPTAAWLAGVWAVENDSSRQDEGACRGDDAMRWRRDGAFEHGSLDGTTLVGAWRLEAGGRLTERPVMPDSDHGAGPPQRRRIERLGRDRMRLIDADGERATLTRCR